MSFIVLVGIYMFLVSLSYIVLYGRSRSKSVPNINFIPNTTILAPCTDNDVEHIAASVHNFLSIAEKVVIVCDSSTRCFNVLQREFRMHSEYPKAPTHKHKLVTGVWVRGSLTVVRKISNRSKGDSNNAGLPYVDTPLVFVCDADTVVTREALAHAQRKLVDENADGCGVPLMPANREGFHAKVQVAEYARAMTLRKGWSKFGTLCNISGGAGLFRTETLKKYGYHVTTCAEDLVSTWTMLRDGKHLTYEPLAEMGTEVPSTTKTKRSQSTRWHRGLFEALWAVKPNKFNRYLGFWLWMLLAEGLEPIIEIAGIIWMCTHRVSPMGWATLAVGILSTVFLTMACTKRRNVSSFWHYAIHELFVKFMSLLWRTAGFVAFLTGDRTWESIPRQER